MAYKPPPELRNRIESIKKRFETVEPTKLQSRVSNSPVSLTDNDKKLLSECRSAATKKVSSPIVDSKVVNCTENKGVENSKDRLKATSSYSGKGNIRRTPAFRCDKPVLSHQSFNVDKKTRSVVNTRVKLFEDQHQINTESSPTDKNTEKEGVIHWKQGKTQCSSKPEIKLRKPPVTLGIVVNEKNPGSNVSKYNIESKLKIAKEGRDKFVVSRKEYKCELTNGAELKSVPLPDGNILQRNEGLSLNNETSFEVSRECGNTERQFLNEEGQSKVERSLTSSLKAALKAPLPPGPPPKKPPRTFVHNSPSSPDGGGKMIFPMITTEKSKTESCLDSSKGSCDKRKILERSTTEPHIMLKKLERVLLKHQQGIGSVVIKPRTVMMESSNEKQQKMLRDDVKRDDFSKEGVPLPQLPTFSDSLCSKDNGKTSPEKLSGGCFDFESLNCVSNVPKHFYEKLPETRSEFFIESPLCSRRSNSANCKTKTEFDKQKKPSLGRSSSMEHIYAEPYACVDVDAILRTEMSVKGKAAENLVSTCTQFPKTFEQKSSTLHYMCSPINPLDRMDALLNSTNVNNVNNNDNRKSQTISCENKNIINGSNNTEIKSDDMAPPQKSFLHFNAALKNTQNSSANLTVHRLDRNKVQLFINQAFGSPLHDSPIASLDSTSSDESSPTTPEEMNPPGIENEEGTSKKEEGSVALPSQRNEAHGELSHCKHQDMTKLTEERKVYVRRVSSRIFNTRQRLSSQPFSHLFHCIMLIGLNLDGEKKTKVPYIKSKYPVNASVPPLMEHLCFPDAADWPPRSSSDNFGAHCDEQSYSLVITNETGDHMFGYCRRVMPEGMDICLPLAYCILSPYRAKGFYFKILSELESQHGQPEWLQKTFIKELYACEFPNPGQTLKLSNSQGSVPTSVEASLNALTSQLRRPLDSRLEEHDLTLLFSTLTVPILLQVFGSLLLERKVLFISHSLSKLSSCIEALHSILYPFSWQYTFIPVLPSAHIGVCEAPTPFIIGLLKDKVGKALAVSLEEGIIIDLEESKIVQSMGDESTILPSRLKKCLKMALHLVESTTQEIEPARNVLISEAFVRMFVEICGHYTNHVVTQQDGKKVFEKESFIKAVPLHSVQLFLEWFTETAMFSSFMESRLNEGSDTKGLFEQRAMEHTEEMDKNTMLFLRNYKAINKKVKSFGE